MTYYSYYTMQLYNITLQKKIVIYLHRCNSQHCSHFRIEQCYCKEYTLYHLIVQMLTHHQSQINNQESMLKNNIIKCELI